MHFGYHKKAGFDYDYLIIIFLGHGFGLIENNRFEKSVWNYNETDTNLIFTRITIIKTIKKIITSIEKYVKKLEPSYTADENIKRCSCCYTKQAGSSSKW